jgi:prepilin-type N-terminal cleavage/methylation domain-containing protein
MRWRGFTLLELLAVIIVIGILAAIALPNFTPMREKTLDKEAQASLRLVLAAQKIYRMESTFYFPHSTYGGAVDNTVINQFLKLELPTVGNRAWDYITTAGPPACAQGTRLGDDNRTWRQRSTENDALKNQSCP